MPGRANKGDFGSFLLMARPPLLCQGLPRRGVYPLCSERHLWVTISFAKEGSSPDPAVSSVYKGQLFQGGEFNSVAASPRCAFCASCGYFFFVARSYTRYNALQLATMVAVHLEKRCVDVRDVRRP